MPTNNNGFPFSLFRGKHSHSADTEYNYLTQGCIAEEVGKPIVCGVYLVSQKP